MLRPATYGAAPQTIVLQTAGGPALASPSALTIASGLSLSAPPFIPVLPAPLVAMTPKDLPAAPGTPAVKLAVMSAGVQAVTEGLSRLNAPAPAQVREAGDQVEDILTGRSRAAEPVPAAPQASQEELAFTAKAALDLATLAEDWGAERGLKSSRMQGQDFLDMLDAGLARYAEQYRSKAPSPQAYAAARTVQAQVVRLVKAMLKPGEPLDGQIRRILSVWNVFNQEMTEAARKGSTQAIEDEARLFAEQVEQSV